ncbi:MAG: SDR family NAD(P)-dependent oxidoreductase, partial [Betaproteobacteria bacterium]|nr:SDR family NAD(P)-dependent oxidoreductase [Betaproteobacteria bacterium]
MHPVAPVTILTGASRGLGLAIAKQLLDQGHRLLTLQRVPNPELEHSEHPNALIEQWSVDLTSPLEVARRLQDWVAALARESVSELNLINNAALLVEPGPLAGSDFTAISQASRAGLEAPLLLSAAFLHASADL